MKIPVESYIGTGWDQLLSLLTIMGLIASVVSIAVITWLRARLRKYFITRPDHELMLETLTSEHEATRDSLKAEHQQNISRLVTVEEQLKNLATRHSVTGVEQRQESLNHRVNVLSENVSNMAGQMGGVIDSNRRVEHMMNLVLEHMISGGAKG